MTKMAVLGRGSMRDKQKVRILFTLFVPECPNECVCVCGRGGGGGGFGGGL